MIHRCTFIYYTFNAGLCMYNTECMPDTRTALRLSDIPDKARVLRVEVGADASDVVLVDSCVCSTRNRCDQCAIKSVHSAVLEL